MNAKRTGALAPDISMPGFFHRLPLEGQPADWEELATHNGGAIHPEAALTFGHALTGEPVRLHCDDPRYWDQVAAMAQRAAAWLRSQEDAHAMLAANRMTASVGAGML